MKSLLPLKKISGGACNFEEEGEEDLECEDDDDNALGRKTDQPIGGQVRNVEPKEDGRNFTRNITLLKKIENWGQKFSSLILCCRLVHVYCSEGTS